MYIKWIFQSSIKAIYLNQYKITMLIYLKKKKKKKKTFLSSSNFIYIYCSY